MADAAKSLREGALRVSTPNGYLMYSQVTLAVLDEVLRAHGGSVDIPWRDLSEEVRQVVLASFPGAAIDYKVDELRQGIVDSWPADVDDCSARKDWGFTPVYDLERAFSEYLIPTIRQRYQK